MTKLAIAVLMLAGWTSVAMAARPVTGQLGLALSQPGQIEEGLVPQGCYQAKVLADNPLYYWRLKEPSGTSAGDYADANTGTYINSPTLNQVGAAQTGDSSVTLAGASSQFIETTTNLSNPGGSGYSLVAWFNISATNGGVLIGFGNNQTNPTASTSYDRILYVLAGGQVAFGHFSGGIVAIQTTSTYNDGNWHYAVGTWDGSNLRIYVDAALVAGPTAAGAPASYAGYWSLGRQNLSGWPSNPTNSLTGKLQDVAVYGAALTAAQITNHFSGSCAGTATATNSVIIP